MLRAARQIRSQSLLHIGAAFGSSVAEAPLPSTSELEHMIASMNRSSSPAGPPPNVPEPTLAYAVSRPLSSMGMKSLETYGRDLTAEARAGKLDPVHGRDEEVARIVQILLRRTKNNPILIGEPGVGKTAVVESVAQLITSAHCPRGLELCRIVALDIGSLVAGTQYRGAFEERLSQIVDEVKKGQGQIILFVDEVHMLLTAGQVEGGLTAANLLKPALARGELRMIGATTTAEYREHVESDAAFTRRFMSVLIEEPSPSVAVECLRALRPKYEAHHDVALAPAALAAAVQCASRYITDRRLPDSAIDLIDEACALARLEAAAATAAHAPSSSPLPRASDSPPPSADVPLNYLETSTRVWPSMTSTPSPSYAPPVSILGRDATARLAAQQETSSAAEMGWARPCPHCGFAVEIVRGAELCQCPRCTTAFLNVDPQKLLLGVTVLKPKVTTAAAAAAAAATPTREGPRMAGSAPDPQATSPANSARGTGEEAVPAAAAPGARLKVDRRHVLAVAARATGVPVADLVEREQDRLAHLEQLLDARVVGQPHVTAAVAAAVRLARLGLDTDVAAAGPEGSTGKRRRPAASFLFHGPLGVGKSSLAAALGSLVFGPPSHTLRLDMHEYSQSNSVAKLIGAPPGFVGYGRGGILSEAIRTRPYSLVQLEHVDRAHREVLGLIAQILESGSLTDNMSRRIDFTNAILVLTADHGLTGRGPAAEDPGKDHVPVRPGDRHASSQHVVPLALGRDAVLPERSQGASAAHAGALTLEPETEAGEGGRDRGRASSSETPTVSPSSSSALASASVYSPLRALPQEILSRVDAVLEFQPLGQEAMAALVDTQLAEVRAQLQGSVGVRLDVSVVARAALVRLSCGEGAGQAQGAGGERAKNVVRTRVLMPVAKEVLLRGMGGGAAGGHEAPVLRLEVDAAGELQVA